MDVDAVCADLPVEVVLAFLEVGEEGDSAAKGAYRQVSADDEGQQATRIAHPHSSRGSSDSVMGEKRRSLNALRMNMKRPSSAEALAWTIHCACAPSLGVVC